MMTADEATLFQDKYANVFHGRAYADPFPWFGHIVTETDETIKKLRNKQINESNQFE